MPKVNLTLSSVLLLILIGAGILIWRTSLLFSNFSDFFTDFDTGPDSALVINTASQEVAISPNYSHQISENSNAKISLDQYETIQETITRIKRDVHVTGTLISTPGMEQAFFQIEGKPDKSFDVNTQLMDGFIITKITDQQVVLKNQIGDETFSLTVGARKRDEQTELSAYEAGNEYKVKFLKDENAVPRLQALNNVRQFDEVIPSEREHISLMGHMDKNTGSEKRFLNVVRLDDEITASEREQSNLMGHMNENTESGMRIRNSVRQDDEITPSDRELLN